MNKSKWVWLGLFLIVSLVGCRGNGDTLDDVMLTLVVHPDPPRIGPATLAVMLSDAQGEPITGAQMALEGNMNHAGMVPVRAQTSEVAPGRYESSIEFTMGGDWFILVQAILPDGRILDRRVDVPGVDATCGTPVP